MTNETHGLSRRSLLAGTAGLVAAGSCAAPRERRPSAATADFELERFLADVRAATHDGQGAVEEVLARAVSEPASVLRALGEPKRAGIQPLYGDDGLSVFNIVWAPHMMLAPHNHLMWATIGIYTGREDNIVWKRAGEFVEAATAASLSEREVFSLPTDAIHSVTNPIGRFTGAIHVYGGDLASAQLSRWDPETLGEGPFDVEEGRKVFEEANRRLEASG